jgi:Na+/proline symporter
MAMIEIKKDPSRKELAWFGLLLLCFCGIIGALLYWKFDKPAAARIVWISGAALALIYYVIPPLRRPIFLGWMYAAFPIGFVISYVLMAIIYYAVVTPIGVIMRILGRDSMCRRFDGDAASYWHERRAEEAQDRYFRQF